MGIPPELNAAGTQDAQRAYSAATARRGVVLSTLAQARAAEAQAQNNFAAAPDGANLEALVQVTSRILDLERVLESYPEPVLDPSAAGALLRQAAGRLEDLAERVPADDDWHRRHAAWAADQTSDAVQKLQAGAALYASAPPPADESPDDAA